MVWLVITYFIISILSALIYEGFIWKEIAFIDDRGFIDLLLPCKAIWRLTDGELNLAGRIIASVIGQIVLTMDTILFALFTVVFLIGAFISGLFYNIFKSKKHKEEN